MRLTAQIIVIMLTMLQVPYITELCGNDDTLAGASMLGREEKTGLDRNVLRICVLIDLAGELKDCRADSDDGASPQVPQCWARSKKETLTGACSTR